MHTKSITVLLLFVLITWFSPVQVLADSTCHGFKLPRKAEQIETNRYLLDMSFAQAQKFYRRAYAGNSKVKKIIAVTLPGVRAIHYMNLQPKAGKWEGANLSLIKGKVYLFCFVKEEEKSN